MKSAKIDLTLHPDRGWQPGQPTQPSKLTLSDGSQQPVVIDLTATVEAPEVIVDLTKPTEEKDPDWKDLETKGQVLVELINTSSAWKHRAGLAERCASITMVTEHSLPKNKRSKFCNYLRKEGKVAKCGPTVPKVGKKPAGVSSFVHDGGKKSYRSYSEDRRV